MTHDVFICHSSEDRAIAQAVCSKLEEHRIRCWIAPRDVVPGSEYARSIIEAIAATKLTVLVFSENSNRSPHVHRELERTASHGIPILPFRVQDVVPSPAIEYFISDAHWLDALTPPMEEHLEYLVGTVRLLLDREAARSTGAAAAEPAAPAPGGEAPPQSRRRWLWVAAAAAAVVVALVAGLLVLRPWAGSTRDGSAGGTPESTGASSPANPSDTATEQVGSPFVDEFDGELGPGWSWVNEDPEAWSVDSSGVAIRLQQAPPLRNILLREQPTSGSYTFGTHLRFDPRGAGQFAGLVITGDDPDNRLQFGWTDKGLSYQLLEDGNMTDGGDVFRDQFKNGEWVESDLEIEVEDGFYTVSYIAQGQPAWEIDSGRLDPALVRIGLIAYGSGGAGDDTATFDRFVVE